MNKQNREDGTAPPVNPPKGDTPPMGGPAKAPKITPRKRKK